MTERETEQKQTGYPSVDKPWLKYYTKDQREITIPECSIYENMHKHAEKFANATALEYLGKHISYQKMFRQIEAVAKSLKTCGVKQGDIVSVCLPNVPEAVYTFYAINRIGAVANMLDVRCAEKVLVDAVLESDSDVLITLDSVADKFHSLVSESKIKYAIFVSPIEVFGPVLKSLICRKKPELRVPLPSGFMTWKNFLSIGKRYTGEIDGKYIKDADAVIAYTGGTTGEPKGVIGTNETMNAVVEMELKVGFNESIQDSILDIAPPWTYYGVCNSLNVPLCMGLKVMLIPKLEGDGLADVILKLQPNHIVSVPSTLYSFMENAKVQNSDLGFIKSIILGADKLDEGFESDFNGFLMQHNCLIKLSKGYGMTEVMAAAAYSKADANEIGSVGVPYPGNIISAFKDDELFTECLLGETGEIAISGPTLMKGYFGKAAAENSDVIMIHPDGTKWIHTGDLGHVGEDGRIYIDGRLKRMFVKHGYKIFPGSVEHCILKCSDVSQAAVVAVKDDIYGNITKAFVVLKDKNNLDVSTVQKQLEQSVADELYDYEYPDVYEFIDELPLTGMGKIDYKALEAV